MFENKEFKINFLFCSMNHGEKICERRHNWPVISIGLIEGFIASLPTTEFLGRFYPVSMVSFEGAEKSWWLVDTEPKRYLFRVCA